MTRVASLAAAGLLLGLLAPDLATERVSLASYYPAPSGVYSRLLTTGDTYLARDPGARVGIGTTAPSAMLEVVERIRFAAGRGELSDQGDNPGLSAIGSFPILFTVNGVEKARVDAGGNFGIGTQSPATKLEINGVLSFTAAGPGYAKICSDVAYEGYAGGAFTLCPANTTPLRSPVGFWCSVGGEVQPCALPASGTMRCCRMAP